MTSNPFASASDGTATTRAAAGAKVCAMSPAAKRKLALALLRKQRAK